MHDDVQLLVPIPASGVPGSRIPDGGSAGLNRRWALWLERGRVHDQRVRRRFSLVFGVLTVAVVLLYAFRG